MTMRQLRQRIARDLKDALKGPREIPSSPDGAARALAGDFYSRPVPQSGPDLIAYLRSLAEVLERDGRTPAAQTVRFAANRLTTLEKAIRHDRHEK